jgi:hypothetical protein
MAQRPKAKPKSKGQKNTDAKQFERFKEIARKLECDDSKEAFDIAFRKIVPAKIRPARQK